MRSRLLAGQADARLSGARELTLPPVLLADPPPLSRPRSTIRASRPRSTCSGSCASASRRRCRRTRLGSRRSSTSHARCCRRTTRRRRATAACSRSQGPPSRSARRSSRTLAGSSSLCWNASLIRTTASATLPSSVWCVAGRAACRLLSAQPADARSIPWPTRNSPVQHVGPCQHHTLL